MKVNVGGGINAPEGSVSFTLRAILAASTGNLIVTVRIFSDSTAHLRDILREFYIFRDVKP
jgi:hypothetical protein